MGPLSVNLEFTPWHLQHTDSSADAQLNYAAEWKPFAANTISVNRVASSSHNRTSPPQTVNLEKSSRGILARKILHFRFQLLYIINSWEFWVLERTKKQVNFLGENDAFSVESSESPYSPQTVVITGSSHQTGIGHPLDGENPFSKICRTYNAYEQFAHERYKIL